MMSRRFVRATQSGVFLLFRLSSHHCRLGDGGVHFECLAYRFAVDVNVAFGYLCCLMPQPFGDDRQSNVCRAHHAAHVVPQIVQPQPIELHRLDDPFPCGLGFHEVPGLRAAREYPLVFGCLPAPLEDRQHVAHEGNGYELPPLGFRRWNDPQLAFCADLIPSY
jgi:hypothetical protein